MEIDADDLDELIAIAKQEPGEGQGGDKRASAASVVNKIAKKQKTKKSAALAAVGKPRV